MDLITLKLANKYTKQQIEKASLEGIQLDKTLTKEGFSADSKAVGDALKDISLTPGPQGPQGPQGPRGEAGVDGRDGVDGVDGKDGINGVNGKSAYQYAQDGGYTGTEEEFAQKLAENPPEGGAPGEDGLTRNEKNLILALFKNAVYMADMSATIAQLETLWSETPDTPETGVEQSGSILSIVSGVNISQSGDVLSIS